MEKSTHDNWKVIRLGGSILVPEFADGSFLKNFRDLILDRTHLGEKFLIIVGGGYVTRKYQEALIEAGVSTSQSRDWVGIYTIRLNAELLRLAFADHAHNHVINSPDALPAEISQAVVVCGAEEPGHSSNYDAVVFAEKIHALEIINLSNIDYVYDTDPRVNSDATKYPEVSWEQYRSFIPSEWVPGMSTPFDPKASRRAQKLGLDVVFMKGRPIENLLRYLESGGVQGSVISNRFA